MKKLDVILLELTICGLGMLISICPLIDAVCDHNWSMFGKSASIFIICLVAMIFLLKNKKNRKILSSYKEEGNEM